VAPQQPPIDKKYQHKFAYFIMFIEIYMIRIGWAYESNNISPYMFYVDRGFKVFL
jgi:hypothetical protein